MNLEQLKAGDKVVRFYGRSFGRGSDICEIFKVTPKQAVIKIGHSECRYRLSDGFMVGGNGHIRLCTSADVEAERIKQQRYFLSRIVEKNQLSDAQVDAKRYRDHGAA